MNSTSLPSSTVQITSEIQRVDVEKKVIEVKLKYQHISNEIRNQIVTRFLVEGHKLIDISRELGVNYSSAKTIIKVFREQKRIKKIQPSQRHVYSKRELSDCTNDGDYHRVLKDMQGKLEGVKVEESEFEPQVGKKVKKIEKTTVQKVCGIRYLDEGAPSTTSESTQVKMEDEMKMTEEPKKLLSNTSKQWQKFTVAPPQSAFGAFPQFYNFGQNYASPVIPNNGFQNLYFGNYPMVMAPQPLFNFGLPSFGDMRLGMLNGYF